MRILIGGKLLVQEPMTEYIVKEGAKYAFDVASDVILQVVHDLGVWLLTKGVLLLAEGFTIWAMICIMMAITGTGKWLERGAKSLIISFMLGMVRYAV